MMIILVLCFNLQYVSSHLKNMGEIHSKEPDFIAKIVGGIPTDLSKHPSNVIFLNFGGMCAGTILNRKNVLTAAHCFMHNTNLADMKVLSRARFIFDKQAEIHEVWDYIIHEEYNKPTVFANDIAVVIIHDQFVFGPMVKQSSIINTDEWMNTNERNFTASGWGETKYGNVDSTKPHQLLETYLRFVTKSECEAANNITFGDDTFCLYGDHLRDTCRGDSGGGIFWHSMIVGIVSHGGGCAEAPSMYVNVYFFRAWIRKSVEKLVVKYCTFHKNGQHNLQKILNLY